MNIEFSVKEYFDELLLMEKQYGQEEDSEVCIVFNVKYCLCLTNSA